MIQFAIDGIVSLDVSFIQPREAIGRLNPLKLEAGEGSNKNESGEAPFQSSAVVFKILLSHQYEMSFGKEALKQAKFAFLCNAVIVVVSFVRRSI